MQELNKAVSKGDRPLLQDGNLEPSFPGMVDLMFDCWKQTASERPSANEVRTHWNGATKKKKSKREGEEAYLLLGYTGGGKDV